ncbi:major capsid protein [Streptomyces sp. NBC_00038]|uniref:major capsid protein n=1 Tax=Streptomyces sp. NBC_00038 TaxID=2903615 RepID=UPI00225812B9|nr:major capsid protein [Streptomyces sp. NBC_00038]MCX5562721.1 major capsid protein [Streptomyces sp. NBC_00038]MCX5563629.1 major capsid protein [Streptomyces sp. NBC_00038]
MSWTLDTEFIEPTELTGLIRAALADLQVNRFTLSRWLPNVSVDDIAYEFTKGGGGLAETASFRSWDAESKIGRREGIAKVMGELPPISEKIPLNEYDRLRLRKLDTNDERVLALLARDAQRIARNIGARFEVVRGQVLVNAQAPITELQQTVDFGRLGAHSVVAAVLWSDHTNAAPLTDLRSWVNTYEDTNGETPAVILAPVGVVTHFGMCQQVIRQVYPLAPAGTAPMLNTDQVNSVLRSLDLPTFEVYDARVKVDGVSTRITPANAIALLPAAGATTAAQPTDLGATLLGTTAEALESEYSLVASEQPGVVAATYKSKDPIRLWTHAAAVGLPILREPNLTFKAQVIA